MSTFNVCYTYRTAKQILSALLILCFLVPSLTDFVNPDGWANVIVLGLILAALNFAEGPVNRFANSKMSEEAKKEHNERVKEIQKLMRDK